ncbi:MAG: MFS transporter [Candidatus Melainabacteria bacterium]|nr:MFS transporter [Candidatus Melainabacteria bacterium]
MNKGGSEAPGFPMILLTYVGGIVADRFDRRRILYVTVSLHMLQALALVALTIAGLLSVGWIVALAVIGGCIGAFEMPARQSFVPDLVPKEELTNAIGINSAVRNTTRILGPAVAGITIAVFGEAVCFGLNALSYVGSLVTLGMITAVVSVEGEVPENNSQSGSPGGKERIWSILAELALKNVLLFTAAISMFGFQYTVLLSVIVDQILGGGAQSLGYLSSCAGAGALIGSLALASRGKTFAFRRVIGFSGIALSAAIALIGLSTNLYLSLLAVLFAGAAISIQTGGSISLIQASVDTRKRGRVMAVFSIFMIGFAPKDLDRSQEGSLQAPRSRGRQPWYARSNTLGLPKAVR